MSYYISPRFLDKVAIHITKSFLDLPGVRVPLILGIHGLKRAKGNRFNVSWFSNTWGLSQSACLLVSWKALMPEIQSA